LRLLREPERQYRVVYWLHEQTAASAPGAVRLRKGATQPLILVLVNGIRRSGYCDSADGSLAAESVIVRDLIPHIDAQYRTIIGSRVRTHSGGDPKGARENCAWELGSAECGQIRNRTVIPVVIGAGEGGVERLRSFGDHLKSLDIVAEYRGG
jgi:hypothetical protein